MEITRIKKLKIKDISLYVLGIGLKNDYEKNKLKKILKELKEEGKIPVEKIESYIEDDFAFLSSIIKVNMDKRKYEVLFMICGDEEKVLNIAKSIKEKIK